MIVHDWYTLITKLPCNMKSDMNHWYLASFKEHICLLFSDIGEWWFIYPNDCKRNEKVCTAGKPGRKLHSVCALNNENDVWHSIKHHLFMLFYMSLKILYMYVCNNSVGNNSCRKFDVHHFALLCYLLILVQNHAYIKIKDTCCFLKI